VEIFYAMAGGGGEGGGGILTFLPFIFIMVIIYFLMIRPQAKRQKEKTKMLSAIKKGDRIVTVGGIHGSVIGLKNQGKVVVIKVDKNTNLTIAKSAVAGLAGSVSDEETTQIEAQA
jgi:preprotein translocase subunit YajC